VKPESKEVFALTSRRVFPRIGRRFLRIAGVSRIEKRRSDAIHRGGILHPDVGESRRGCGAVRRDYGQVACSTPSASPSWRRRRRREIAAAAVLDHTIARDGLLELRQTCLSAIKPTFRGAGAMKDGIHPDYHEITVVMTDGTTYQTRSTYGKAGDTLRLEIDSKSHPAWTGGQQRLLDSGGQLARFNKRFQGFGLKKK